TDPVTFGVAVGVFLIAAATASAIPALGRSGSIPRLPSGASDDCPRVRGRAPAGKAARLAASETLRADGRCHSAISLRGSPPSMNNRPPLTSACRNRPRAATPAAGCRPSRRSEERRVGKEGQRGGEEKEE